MELPKVPEWVARSWHLSAIVTVPLLVLVALLVWRSVQSSDRNGELLEQSEATLDSMLIEWRYFTGLLRQQDSVNRARRDTAR